MSTIKNVIHTITLESPDNEVCQLVSGIVFGGLLLRNYVCSRCTTAWFTILIQYHPTRADTMWRDQATNSIPRDIPATLIDINSDIQMDSHKQWKFLQKWRLWFVNGVRFLNSILKSISTSAWNPSLDFVKQFKPHFVKDFGNQPGQWNAKVNTPHYCAEAETVNEVSQITPNTLKWLNHVRRADLRPLYDLRCQFCTSCQCLGWR